MTVGCVIKVILHDRVDFTGIERFEHGGPAFIGFCRKTEPHLSGIFPEGVNDRAAGLVADCHAFKSGKIVIMQFCIAAAEKIAHLRSHGLGGIIVIRKPFVRLGYIQQHVDLAALYLFEAVRPGGLYIDKIPAGILRNSLKIILLERNRAVLRTVRAQRVRIGHTGPDRAPARRLSGGRSKNG